MFSVHRFQVRKPIESMACNSIYTLIEANVTFFLSFASSLVPYCMYSVINHVAKSEVRQNDAVARQLNAFGVNMMIDRCIDLRMNYMYNDDGFIH